MSASTSKRLFAVVVAGLALISYIWTRDSIRVEAGVPESAVKPVVRGIEEWSSPKLFRHIEVYNGEEGTVYARVREPGERWSYTVFTNQGGVWTECEWFLIATDKAAIRN